MFRSANIASPVDPLERAAVNASSGSLDALHRLDDALLQRYRWLVHGICRISGSEGDDGIDPTRFAGLDTTLDWSWARGQFESLNVCWEKLQHCASPVSGYSHAEQLDRMRELSTLYIAQAEDLRQRCWREFTVRDALTGAFNRHALENTLREQRERATAKGDVCLLILADHDGFKQVNDEYGHQVGDLLLAHTSRLLHDAMRTDDFLFRFGGDEWLLLFPGIQVEQIGLVEPRLQQSVRAHPLLLPDGRQLRVRLSMGLAISSPSEPLAQWLQRADAELLRVKRPADSLTFVLGRKKLPDTSGVW